ncbi:MAG: hypothetical protein COB30_005175 [Ectothiorhodospiraceae bacterium]|nr:hypothetical protein [Ectothiorhodospiraceae bacterium]
MSELEELNKTIIALSNLMPLIDDDDERSKIQTERDNLNQKSRDLADKTLREGIPELNSAIEALQATTKAANEAAESIDDIEEGLTTLGDAISKSAKAVGAIAKLTAIL